MKMLFLDVDGVLNNDKTTERIGHYTGVDAQLAKRFIHWCHRNPEVVIVLSSTWRKFDDMMEGLRAAGIHWDSVTPQTGGSRGDQVNDVLYANPQIEKYAILDDVQQFTAAQQSHFVQTNPVRGLTDSDLAEIDRILKE